MSKKMMIVLGIAALVGYYLYSRSKTQGVAAAQVATAQAGAPSTFVTARNNLENNLSTSLTNSLSNIGL